MVLQLKVRAWPSFRVARKSWSTVGVSENVIEASFLHSYNGFSMGYDLTGVLKADKLEKKELNVNDFTQITITYTDDLLEAKGLNEKDVKGFVDRRPVWLMRPLPLDKVRAQAASMEMETRRFYEKASARSKDAATRQLLDDLAELVEIHRLLNVTVRA